MPLSPEADLDALFDGPALERDQYGRPLLVPTGEHDMPLSPRWPRKDDKVPFTRASSMSNYIIDQTALHTWQMRLLTKGLSEREDLAAMAAALPPLFGTTRDKKTLSKQEALSDKITSARLDEIAEEAMRYADRDYKANWGTAVHSFTDPDPSGDVPARMAADVQSWFDQTAGWEFLLTEAFVANDELQAAGTFDHLVRIPWRPDLGALIVDKKTGILHLDQFAIQGFTYATGQLYDVVTNERLEWPEQPNQEWAILAHIPLGQGRTDLYLVDLRIGRVHALDAVNVRRDRLEKNFGHKVDFRAEGQAQVASLLSIADCEATLRAIAADHHALWDDSLRAVAQQRMAEFALS